ncbi:MAG: hypothetical protein Fur0046_08070 [Cyanobacteria bacterium J069]
MSLQLYSVQSSGFADLRSDPLPAMLRTWRNQTLPLPDTGTHFGFVYQGQPHLFRQAKRDSYRLQTGMYFCLPGGGSVGSENSSGIIVTRLGYDGMFSLGGPLEPNGRFAYIDGGTNSLLIPPVMRGDACLNAMYFPAQVNQTLHTHPSYRIGLVVSGSGQIETPATQARISPGMIFVIPANALHKFRTDESGFTIVVFHPDSDTGFSHRDNPMLKRTLVEGVSAASLPHLQTKLTSGQGESKSGDRPL